MNKELEALRKIGLMTTKRNLQDFPIGNQPKQIVKMKIKEMPEFQEVANALNELEELKGDVKRFMEIFYISDDSTLWDEYDELVVKLSKVGEEDE